MSSSQSKPDTIEGGCLCEGVRYKITFPPDHDFSKATTTCQCSQCRKQTGALLARLHSVPSSSLAWTSDRTLQLYHATPNHSRGFCSACGSMLFWRRDDNGGGEGGTKVAVSVGTFDRDVLVGAHGRLVTESGCHLFCGDEVPGVTDHLAGERWREDCEGEGAELLK